MVLRSRGTIGISLQDDLFQSLECRFAQSSGELVYKLAHSLCRQAYPNIRTVDYWMGGDASERYPQSRCVIASRNDRKFLKYNNDPVRTAVNHNKAAGFERRLELYLMENFKHAFDMERYDIQLCSTKCCLLKYI